MLPLIGPVEHGSAVLEELSKGDTNAPSLLEAEPYASACLQLVNQITPDQPRSWFGRLGAILDAIRVAQPQLVDSPAYRRLREIAMRLEEL